MTVQTTGDVISSSKKMFSLDGALILKFSKLNFLADTHFTSDNPLFIDSCFPETAFLGRDVRAWFCLHKVAERQRFPNKSVALKKSYLL